MLQSVTPRNRAMTIDSKWFRDSLQDRRMTQREFASRVGIDPASLTLTLQGKRRMTIERAADFARELCVPMDDVMKKFGVGSHEDAQRVPIIGYVDGAAEVTFTPEPIGRTISPFMLPQDVAALTMRSTATPLDMMHGWLFFVGPEMTAADGAIDRTAIVQAKGHRKPLLRLIRRGATPGLFTLTGIGQPTIYDIELQNFRLISDIRPL